MWAIVDAESGCPNGLLARLPLHRISAADEAKGTGVAVEEGSAADGANLSVAEESAEWDWGDDFAENFGIVVGASEQVLSPADAGEH